jgi:hypothetical protein
MSDTAHESGTAAANSASAPEPLVHRIWPRAIVGVGVTVVWICLLAYAFGRLFALI